jgi:hypothetical protein
MLVDELAWAKEQATVPGLLEPSPTMTARTQPNNSCPSARAKDSGPTLEHDPLRSPLTAALLRDGYARPDCARLGIAAGLRGQALGRDGRPSDRLFALGQPCRASRWVPEIVRDAVSMAELFEEAQSTHRPGPGH